VKQLGPALSSEELQVLERPGRRWRARRAMRRRSGRRAALLLKRLHRQQLSLAMLRTRLSDDDAPDLVPRSPARGDRWIPGRGLSQPLLS
jgi:hypothetical protein